MNMNEENIDWTGCCLGNCHYINIIYDAGKSSFIIITRGMHACMWFRYRLEVAVKHLWEVVDRRSEGTRQVDAKRSDRLTFIHFGSFSNSLAGAVIPLSISKRLRVGDAGSCERPDPGQHCVITCAPLHAAISLDGLLLKEAS
jgi:hypothetical protein